MRPAERSRYVYSTRDVNRLTSQGIGALETYRREWDDEKKTFKKSAVEDWTTDPADSFRYLALSWRQAPLREVKLPAQPGYHIPPPAEPRRGVIRL